MPIQRDQGWVINPGSANPNDYIVKDIEKQGGFKTFATIADYTSATVAAAGVANRFTVGDIAYISESNQFFQITGEDGNTGELISGSYPGFPPRS